VNDNDEDDDNHHEPPEATSPPKEDVPELLIEGLPATEEPGTPQKLYPSAPQLDESDETTSAHSTEV
jgi:hypothetical protein